MADYLKRPRIFEEDRGGMAFREVFTPFMEGPLPPRPRPSGKGGPSINQGTTPVATSKWSASDAAANAMTLSNGGLTATPSGYNGNQAIRGTVSHSSGKYYIEFTTSVAASNEAQMFGVADASFVATNNYLGSNGVSAGIQLAGANYGTAGFTSNYVLSLGGAPGANDVWMLAIDLTAGKIWIGANNAWIGTGASPASGTAPIISIAAPALGVALFPGMTFYGTAQGIWTLQPTAASQKYAPPAGFAAWG